MIAAYAWSDKGRETSGTTEHLYVYGINENNSDTDGPVFEAFYVNSPTLPDGAVVNSNMVVYARLRDESGINVSQSGIGHSLTLAIDGKDYRSDLANYFESDIADPDLGLLLHLRE